VSNYPAWWNTTITVFNKYEDPTTRRITWYKTVLQNCFWKNTGNRIVAGETTLETDSTICRIPLHPQFLENYQWNDIEDKSLNFTLSTGDILVRGEVTDEIDEYASGVRSSDILTKYKKLQGCMVIDKCAINTGLGRGLEHYYVRGV
jgi:hypothetical protein